MAADSWHYVLTIDGQDVDLTDGEVTLGRSRSATVRVDHESVSRNHALVTFENGNAIVKDLNSSNGTYVSGKRVTNDTRVKDGDRIQLGAAIVGVRIVAPEGDRTAMMDAGLAPVAPEDGPAPAGHHSGVKPLTFEQEIVPEPAAAPEAPPKPPRNPLEISADDLFPDLRPREQPRAAPPPPMARPPSPPSPVAHREPYRPPPDPYLAAPDPFLPGPEAYVPSPPQPQRAPAPEAVAPPPAVPRAYSAPRQVPREEPRPYQQEEWQPRREPDPPAFGERPEAGAPDNLAGFFPRFAALIVDNVILTALDLIFLSPVFLILFFRPGIREGGPDLMLLGIGFLCFLVIAGANVWYVIGGWAKSGKTPGKALLGLAIVSETSGVGEGLGWKTAMLRALGYIAGAIPLYAGFLMVLFRKDRRALHDLMARTWVVSVR